MPCRVGAVMPRKPLAERLWAKVDRSGGPEACWPFNGYRSPFGYGQIRTGPLGTPKIVAHRAAYELLVGPIPDGLQLDHLCGNPPCCNPAHLEPVTAIENTMRSPIAPAAVNARRTHCVHGHPFDDKNTATYLWAGRTHRRCRTCLARIKRARRMRLAAARVEMPAEDGVNAPDALIALVEHPSDLMASRGRVS